MRFILSTIAEFRGPGVHHNFDDSDSGYDVEEHNKLQQGGSGGRNFGIGGYRGRIIFLGDGTEVLTDSDDTEMFDNAEEDKDLASQVAKPSATGSEDASKEAEKEGGKSAAAPGEGKKEGAADAATTGKSESAAEEKADEKKQA